MKARNRGDNVEKGPFTKVVYVFNDLGLVPLWRPVLDQNIGSGNFEVRQSL
jgi:hypothetical protein